MSFAVDQFAGPGGWDVACRELGIEVVGYELDQTACQTRTLAGLRTVRADVAAVALTEIRYPVEGLIASPPCPAFSSAGKQEGVKDIPSLLSIARHLNAADPDHDEWAPVWDRWVALGRPDWHHPESPLVLEVLRWAHHFRPRWIACEQVKEVLPFWRAAAETLQRWGYRTWAGILNSADYGVPQTRRRAILMASLDRQPHAPNPTHHDPRKGLPMFGLPWVSMAEALGWAEATPVNTGHGQAPIADSGQPARTVVHASRSWLLHTNRDQREDGSRQTRPVSEPAPALTGKSGGQWKVTTRGDARPQDAFDPEERPAKTVTGKEGWTVERPATTVCGDARIGRPGHKDREGGEAQFEKDSIKITVREAAILQGFPPDYPWQGTRTAQFRQIGNAIPVGLAKAILEVLVGEAADAAAV